MQTLNIENSNDVIVMTASPALSSHLHFDEIIPYEVA